jgi:exosortase/archaeosortase family protein
VAAAAGGLEIALASRWGRARDHFGAVAVGWIFALALAWRSPPVEPAPRAAERIAGAIGLLAGLAFLVRGWSDYRPLDRLLPLALGLSAAAMADGVRGWRRHARSLAALGAALVCPLPSGMRGPLLLLEPSAATAGVMLHLVRFPVTRSGVVLSVSASTVEVTGACAPTGLIGQLLVLVLVALCLFRASWVQRALLLATAVVTGFLVNAARIAFLCVVAARAPGLYDAFDGEGSGAAIFPIAAVTLLGLVWWIVLHPPGPTLPGPKAADSGTRLR